MSAFITLEGGEGSGKTSAAKALALKLENLGIPFCLTREPGGTSQGEKIRGLFLQGEVDKWCGESESLLAFASRIEHWNRLIEPSLNEGKIVICDRFIDSTYAYQCYGRGVSIDLVNYLSSIKRWTPTRTYFFDCNPEIGLKRSIKRLELFKDLESRFESFDIDFHKRVYLGFVERMNQDKDRFFRIDASKSIEDVQKSFINDVIRFFVN